MKSFVLLSFFSLFCCGDDVQERSLLCKTGLGGDNVEDGVWYEGECRDPAQDGLCGDEALGERLWLTKDGRVQCDCDEGWLRLEGRCHQEFSPAVCGDGKILNLGSDTRRRSRLRGGQTHNCIRNPCGDDTLLPHSLSWKKNGFCHDVSHLTDIRDCELCVSNSDFDLSPLRCCSPSNRTQCCQTFHVDLPSVLLGGGRRRCRRGQIYSKFRGGCIPLFGR